MTTLQTEFSRGGAAGRPRHRRAADRRTASAATVDSTRTALRLAPHQAPVAGHRGLGGAARRAVLDPDPRRPPRDLAGELPQRGAVEVPHPRRVPPGPSSPPSPASARSRASGPCSGILPMPDFSALLRRGHHRHGHRPHRQRAVRGPRPRRGRIRRPGRPRPHVVRGPGHRLRAPGHRRPDRPHARPAWASTPRRSRPPRSRRPAGWP